MTRLIRRGLSCASVVACELGGGAMEPFDAVIIGAGPAGLSCAAALKAGGLRVAVLEKAAELGPAWRGHYDRLHLHTDRNHSGLWGMKMPRSYPTYPSRAEVVAYLEAYAAHFGVTPFFGQTATRATRRGGVWAVEAADTFSAPVLVVATGLANAPHAPRWPGQDAFVGEIVHSSRYRNPLPYAGRRVLVVGFGNSGGEIALDLAEAGIDVSLSVRGPVQILPRDLFGIPIIALSIFYGRLPARLVDAINAPVLRRAVGRIEELGLTPLAKGPRQTVEETGRVPIFDIGTLAKIRDGAIKIRGAIERFSPEGVVFADGRGEAFDAVILATGFRQDLRPLLPEANGVFDDRGLPLATGAPTAEPGLFFCGLIVSPTGQFREFGIEAGRIAGHVAKRFPRRA